MYCMYRKSCSIVWFVGVLSCSTSLTHYAVLYCVVLCCVVSCCVILYHTL